MNDDKLQDLRQRVSQTNQQILELLNRRAALVLEAWEEKQRRGLPLRDLEREAQMLEEIAAANQGPFPNQAVESVFQEVFRISRELMEMNTTPR